ncbi:MAG: glutathione S-transferase family protein [Alphaproteobacteria bacterium]|nr:glutathione S-transferase family protein [Alphaproteobacteria bacterium]
MIDLYTWTTPNGRKVSIMLEETGLPYTAHPINIGKQEQFAPEFLKLSPNNKIPAILDRDTGISVFESGAILIYLAEKTGKFLPASGAARAKTLEWLMWQMSAVGPIIGQLGHFMNAAEKVPYAIKRFGDESLRIMKVLDGQLANNEYIAGDYSIADIAAYPWLILSYAAVKGTAGDALDGAAIERWLKAVGDRPAVVKGLAVPKV